MFGNMETDLFWLRLLDKCLTKECSMTSSKAYFFIFYKKDDYGKLELVVSIHEDNLFMAGRLETLEKCEE